MNSRTGAACLAALLILAAPCHADVEDRIARCSESDSAGERIGCLEDSLRELAGERAAEEPPGDEPGQDAEQVGAAQSGGEPGPGAEQLGAAQSGDEPGHGAEQVGPARSGAGPELGVEQVRPARSGDEAEPRIRATVVDFRFVGYRRLMVELGNGQVWRQIDGDRTSVERGLRNAQTFDVEMWGTKLGGYRMHILMLGRTLRVERLR